MSWIDEARAELLRLEMPGSAARRRESMLAIVRKLEECGARDARGGLALFQERINPLCLAEGQEEWLTPPSTDEELLGDIPRIAAKLDELEARMNDPYDILNRGATRIVNENVFNPVNNVSSSSASSATALARATYAEACGAIEGLGLDEAQKDELLDLLNGVRKSGKDESLAKHAVKSLLDKAIGLGFDALKAVLPYVWGFLLALGGSA